MLQVGLYYTATHPPQHTKCKQTLNKGQLQSTPSERTMMITNHEALKGNTKNSREQQAWKISDTVLRRIQSDISIKTQKGQNVTTQRNQTQNPRSTLETKSLEVQLRSRNGSHDRTSSQNREHLINRTLINKEETAGKSFGTSKKGKNNNPVTNKDL